MARTPQDVTEAELNVLELLWAEGPATIRHLADTLYPGGGATQYATVQKLLERLQAKGCVERDRSSGKQLFAPAIQREDLIDRRLNDLAEQLCGGSLAPLISHLVRADRLSAIDRRSLRDLIEELDSPRTRRAPKDGRK
jgi:predicted transcriptional regulator